MPPVRKSTSHSVSCSLNHFNCVSEQIFGCVAVVTCWGSYHRVGLKRSVCGKGLCCQFLFAGLCRAICRFCSCQVPPNTRNLRCIKLKMRYLTLLQEISKISWLTKPTYLLTDTRSHVAQASPSSLCSQGWP